MRAVDLAGILGPEVFGDRDRVPYWGRRAPWDGLPAYGFTLALLGLAAPLVAGRAAASAAALALAAIALGLSAFPTHARSMVVGIVPLALAAALALDGVAAGRAAPARLLAAAGGIAAIGVALAAAVALGLAMEPADWDGVVRGISAPAERSGAPDMRPHLADVRALARRAAGRAAAIALVVAAILSLASSAGAARVARRAMAPAALLLTALETVTGTAPMVRSSRAPVLSPATAAFLAGRPDGTRIHAGAGFPPALATLLALESPAGSADSIPAWTRELLAAIQGRPAGPATGGTIRLSRFDAAARLAGVSRVVARTTSGAPPPGMAHGASPADDRFYRAIEPAWPRAWIVHRARWCAGADATLATLARGAFDPAREVVLEQARGGRAPGTPFPAGPAATAAPLPARLVERSPTRLTVEATLDRPGYLVVAESYHPAWRAAVAGRELPVLRANHGLRAVELPAGRHSVTMTFAPASARAGWAAGLLALVLTVLSARRAAKGTAGTPEAPERPGASEPEGAPR
jgi:hypothetical protein